MDTLIYKITSYWKKHPKAVMGELENYQVPDDIEEITDLPYSALDGSALNMYIYREKAYKEGKRPVLLMVHGGGLFVDARTGERAFCCRMARMGYLIFSLDYRLFDQADGCQEIDDVIRGIEYAAKHLDTYQGDPDRIYVISESAGAFLAIYACAALKSQLLQQTLACQIPKEEIDIKKLVCFSGMFYTTAKDPVGMMYAPQIYGKKRFQREFRRLMAPDHPEVVDHLPPVLMTSSSADFLRRHTLRYRSQLKAAGHSCNLLYYRHNKELLHAFPSLRPDLEETEDVLKKMNHWLLKKKS